MERMRRHDHIKQLADNVNIDYIKWVLLKRLDLKHNKGPFE